MKKAIVVAVFVVAVIGIILWQSSAITSLFQNSASIVPGASYTTLLIRSGNPSEPIKLGDTEYSFHYMTVQLTIYAPFQSDYIPSPKIGDSYQGLGIELKVANVTSDYLSGYIVINVRPTINSYMFSTYHLTQVDFPVGKAKTVDISSGLIDRTNQLTFAYPSAPPVGSGATLYVSNTTQSKSYLAYAGLIVVEAKNDFDIEIRVSKIDSTRMLLYVKPLY